LQVFQRGDFLQAELRPEKETGITGVVGNQQIPGPSAAFASPVPKYRAAATAGAGQRHRAEGG
jgi:hypothetical protein